MNNITINSPRPKSIRGDRRAYRKWCYWNVPGLREKTIRKSSERRAANPDLKLKRREKYANDPVFRAQKKAASTMYRKNNPEKIRELNRRRYAQRKASRTPADRSKFYAYVKKWRPEYYKRNPSARLAVRLSGHVRGALKGEIKKIASTIELLGCSIEHLKIHLESKFTEGMTWDTYGKCGWHIEHKIPRCRFNLEDPEQQRICFNWKNLQPMWALDNYRKGRKLPMEVA